MLNQWYARIIATSPASKPFLLCKGQVLTYGEVDGAVRKLTAVFQARQLEQGDYIFLNVKDDGQLAVIYLACLANGLAAVVTDPSLPSLQGLLAKVNPRLAFIDRETKESSALPGGLDVITVNEPQRKTRGLFKKLLKKTETAEHEVGAAVSFPALMDAVIPFGGVFPAVEPQLTALVLFTSGTTSEPKGVQLTRRNIATQIQILRDQLSVDERTQLFNILPLHHTDGITNGVTLAFFAGATLHRPAKFSIHDLPNSMDYIFREGISHLITVPTVLALIQRLGDDFEDAFQSGDFKVLLSAAAYLSPDLWQSFQDRFKVRISNGYGLTETVTMFAFSGPDDASFRIGTVGKPVASQIRLVDDAGLDVPPGSEGELWVAGDLVMKGYINSPEATAAAITDGWLQTGDTARIAEDGKIEILGRKKNIIIHGGINIHPQEIMDAALEHEAVLDAVAFGEPDDTWGEIAVLCIVEDIEANLSDTALNSFLTRCLASEKMPHEIHRFADFPRGPSGKAIIRELQEQVAQRKLSSAFSDEGDPLAVILGIGASLLKVAPETLSRSSSAESVRGWDSLFHLNFILVVEEVFSVQFLPREIMSIQSLGDLVALAEKYGRSKLAGR